MFFFTNPNLSSAGISYSLLGEVTSSFSCPRYCPPLSVFTVFLLYFSPSSVDFGISPYAKVLYLSRAAPLPVALEVVLVSSGKATVTSLSPNLRSPTSVWELSVDNLLTACGILLSFTENLPWFTSSGVVPPSLSTLPFILSWYDFFVNPFLL